MLARWVVRRCSFFFNDTATTEIYTLPLPDALPISRLVVLRGGEVPVSPAEGFGAGQVYEPAAAVEVARDDAEAVRRARAAPAAQIGRAHV
mgnify:CR=1 FL=1